MKIRYRRKKKKREVPIQPMLPVAVVVLTGLFTEKEKSDDDDLIFFFKKKQEKKMAEHLDSWKKKPYDLHYFFALLLKKIIARKQTFLEFMKKG